MAEPRDISVLLPNLAVLLFAAIGILTGKTPLLTTRPANDTAPSAGQWSERARLWQDPFQVTAQERTWRQSVQETDGDAGQGISAFDGRIARAMREKAKGWEERFGQREPTPRARVLILPVLLCSDPYAEDVENRLRIRYAVLSALGRAQYVPVDPDRIRFLHLPRSVFRGRRTLDNTNPNSPRTRDEPGVSGSSAQNAEREMHVPFEEFEVRYLVTDNVAMCDRTGKSVHESYWPGETSRSAPGRVVIEAPYDRVIVMWLDETRLSRQRTPRTNEPPSATSVLAEHISDIVGACVSRRYFDDRTCELKIIGSMDTDDLLGLFEPAKDFAPAVSSATILSPRATAAWPVLWISSTRQPQGNGCDSAEPRARQLGNSAWYVERTITTDDRLIGALLWELRLRNAEPSQSRHVVLVGEWDTLYARGLGRTMSAMLQGWRPGEPIRREIWSEPVSFLHEKSYLRGLDGRVPGASSSADTQKSDDDASASILDRPVGQSQYDYLRRLEGELHRLRNRLRHDGGADVAAIGVVGSDVYDKLLVLRALRKSFPDVLFFTTDTDALYLDAAEASWTRNLLVVSSFGLTANEALQDRIPPFRDSYQTATFLTVLRALNVSHVGQDPFVLEPEKITPRIFEVGRSGFVDLSSAEPAERADLHPKRIPPLWRRWISPRGAMLLGSLVFAFLFWRTCLCKRTPGPRSQGLVAHLVLSLAWAASACGLVTGLHWSRIHSQAPAVDSAASGFQPDVFVVPVCSIALLIAAPFVMWWLSGFVDADTGRTKPGQERFGTLFKEPLTWICLVVFFLQILFGTGILGVGLWRAAHDAGEELFYWFQGVSIWPAEVVRALAIALSIGFAAKALRNLREQAESLERRFSLPRLGSAHANKTIATWQASPAWPRWRRLFWPKPTDNESPENDFWAIFRHLMTTRRRMARVFIFLLLHVPPIGILFSLLGTPTVPARGAWSLALDKGILAGSVFCYLFLLACVFDATVMCCGLVNRLASDTKQKRRLVGDHLMNLVGELTGFVSKLVYLPFSILFMLIVARNRLFDAWTWEIALVIVMCAGLALIVTSTTMLRRAARCAKGESLAAIDKRIREARIRLRRTAARATRTPPDLLTALRLRIEHAETLRRTIVDYEGPAFQAWHRNPIYGAMLIPLGGVGSLQVLEKLSTLFS